MSKPVNPALVGGFTIGALILVILALLVFGAGQELRADKARYVVFFDSSLNGLDVGAPVKLQGVKIGQVKEISLQIDVKEGKFYKPVVLEIDKTILSDGSRGETSTSIGFEKLKEDRDRLVEMGMRARLEIQSLLTGLLYVDLNFYPDKPPVYVGLEHDDLLEIPGVPTTVDELRSTAEAVARKLRALPLDEIVQDLADNLREIKTMLASEDVERSRIALADTLEELKQTTRTLNSHLDPLLKNTDKAIKDTDGLVRDTHEMMLELKNELPGLMTSGNSALTATASALQKAEESLHNLDNVIGPESEFADTLTTVKQAARSIRDLGDYLERHPEAILAGKDSRD